MKKISAGIYEGTYNYVNFSVQKIEQINSKTRNKWIWLINGKGGEDWFDSKRQALEAVKDFIDNK